MTGSGCRTATRRPGHDPVYRRRRRIVARVRAVHGVVGTLAAVSTIIGMLVIISLGDRAFEVYELAWAPLATGGAVAAVLFIAFEVERRARRATLTACGS